MVFSSISFLCGFLFVCFCLYSIIPNIKIKNIILIIFSLIFYSVGEPIYVFLMIGMSFINYIFGVLIGRSKKLGKLWLVLSVVLNIGVLFVFKYINFIIINFNSLFNTTIPITKIVMPIGISFFTFQAMSYVIDVYRNECKYQRNFFNVLLYISFFPQLIAGPIIKYHDMEQEISDRKQSLEDVESGIRRFIIGLSKKVIISNAVACVVDELMLDVANMTVLSAWVMAIGYALQIYYDFSGYSDMAIGLGRMFGFHFKENFNYPYASTSIKEFWRRWHISLSTWFKEYVYIPLGGNRNGKLKTILNKYIVFFLTGFWHGANWTFILWGLIHGTFSVLEETKLNISKVRFKFIGYIYTMLIVILAFVIFRADNLMQAFDIFGRMFGVGTEIGASNHILLAQLTPYKIFAFLLGLMFMVPWVDSIIIRIKKNEKLYNVYYIISGVILMMLLLLCVITLASDSYNPFIYFRF
ncbi:MAG: MBOAT family protein [Lachnospiraceae bacterium]|nr:MBOAT family protein [Lachnospiraceae bacterium]